jgi:hypothetical protein
MSMPTFSVSVVDAKDTRKELKRARSMPVVGNMHPFNTLSSHDPEKVIDNAQPTQSA